MNTTSIELIDCPACGKKIAGTAQVCPGCGAPNTWKHPEVLRIWSQIESGEFETARQWRYNSDRTAIWGYTEGRLSEASRTMVWVAGAVGFLVFLLQFAISPSSVGVAWLLIYPGAFAYGMAWYRGIEDKINPSLQESFKITIADGVAVWQSNNDQFWKPLRDKLQLNKPA